MAWTLNKVKHFNMGCPDQHISVNHKPLLGMLSKTLSLEDINNPRLCWLVK